jgi:hypothetical protein
LDTSLHEAGLLDSPNAEFFKQWAGVGEKAAPLKMEVYVYGSARHACVRGLRVCDSFLILDLLDCF